VVITTTVTIASSMNQFGKRAGDTVYDACSGILKKALNYTRVDMQLGFESYFEVNRSKFGKVKTIVNRFQPVELVDIYEDSEFEIEESSQRVTESEIFYSEKYEKTIITGTAGSGKSFFMKRSFLRFCEGEGERIPVFLELRKINSSGESIFESIVEQFTPHISFFDRDFVKELFSHGRAIIFLDGYDELYANMKPKVSKQIDELAYNFPRLRIVVSGRPDERFAAWNEFTELNIAPLNKKRCLSLIAKSQFPNDLRDRFYKNVEESIYESHISYLQNPLMTYVMLFTSDQFVEFPNDIGTFYYKAFETLFRGHDVMKSGEYQREVLCPIKMKDLEAVVGYFCAISFLEERYDYTPEKAIFYLKKAIKLAELNVSPDDLLIDLAKNYCMLVVDGGKYNYIHRTFQEYFAASCLSLTEIIDYYEYNDSIIQKNIDSERYIKILSEIGAERFYNKYLIPKLKQFVEEFYVIRNRNPKKLVTSFVQEFGVDELYEVRMIRVSDERKWRRFESSVLNVVNREMFPSLFDIKEDPDIINNIPLKKYHGLTLRIMSFEKTSASQIRKTKIYAHYKSLVDSAKKYLDFLTKRNARLKSIANK